MLMRPSILPLGGAALLLSACGGTPSEEAGTGDASPAVQVATKSGPFRAGLYNVVQTGDVEIEEERCFHAADIAAGRFGAPASAGDGWTLDSNRMSDGVIKVSASHPNGSRLNIGGTFEPESFEVAGLFEMKLNGETHVVRTKQRGVFASPTCPEGMD